MQSFAMGRGLQIPNVGSVFCSPAPTDYLLVRMQRSQNTFVVHFPIEARADAPYAANALVFRATAAFEGYTNCAMQDATLARLAAGL